MVASKLESQLDFVGEAPRIVSLQYGNQLFQW